MPLPVIFVRSNRKYISHFEKLNEKETIFEKRKNQFGYETQCNG